MTMDWANERWVRIYTRDTAEWLCLCWQARALWPLLVRKADRAGVIETRLGNKGIAALVGLPLDVVAEGMDADNGLLADGCIEVGVQGFVIPNFLAAQEAAMSDAFRQRESRERRGLSHRITRGHTASQNVTVPSRNVTKSHEPSRTVTRGHDLSLLSDPSLPTKHSPPPLVDNSDAPSQSGRPVAAAPLRAVSSDDEDRSEMAPPPRKAPPTARGGAQGPITTPQAKGIPDPPVEAMQLAYSLAEYVATNHPESRFAKQPELRRESAVLHWGEVFRKMHAIDRLSYDDMQAMVVWSQRHAFWKTRILNAQAFRDAWDTMRVQRKAKREERPARGQESTEDVERRRKADRERNEAENARQRAADAKAAEDRAEVMAATAELKQRLGVA